MIVMLEKMIDFSDQLFNRAKRAAATVRGNVHEAQLEPSLIFSHGCLNQLPIYSEGPA